MPTQTFTLSTSNDVVPRKEVPFGGQKNKFQYLTPLLTKIRKIPIPVMVKF